MLDLSCTDWEARIRGGKSLLPKGLPLCMTEVQRAVTMFDLLQLPDVPGTPALKDAAGDWARDLVRAVFGSYDPVIKRRIINEFFCMIPKKNSKTTYGAAIMLVAVLMSRRPRAEFLMVAPTQAVSELAFNQAVGMILLDPVLRTKFRIREHLKMVVYEPSGCFLKVKSFDPRVVTGTKPAGILMDETHVIAEAADADRVMGQLRGGLISQPEGFLLQITTQSERPPSGVFLAELKKARAVRDGKLRTPILPIIYELPPDVDWRNPANFWMVTPNRDRSITVARLEQEFVAAEAAGKEELLRWASQHLNVQVGIAMLSNNWAGAAFWEACETDLDAEIDDGSDPLGLEAMTVQRRSMQYIIDNSDVITVGIDGGGLDDLLGFTVLGRHKLTGQWLLWCKAYAHPIVLERRKEDEQRFRDFAADGDLMIVDKIGDDIEDIAKICAELYETGLLDNIGVDPMGIGAIVQAIVDAGVPVEKIVAISQGWKMTGAIKTLERKLAEMAVVIFASAMMRWCAGNAKVEPRGNAIIITKQASGSAKIDPLMSTFNAVSLMALAPEPENFDTYFDFLAARGENRESKQKPQPPVAQPTDDAPLKSTLTPERMSPADDEY